MRAHIEIVGVMDVRWFELTDFDLRSIGEFTRKNLLKWTESHRTDDWVDGVLRSQSWNSPAWVGLLPAKDIRAVCDGINIPWATEEAKLLWAQCFSTDSHGLPVDRPPVSDVGQMKSEDRGDTLKS